MTKLLNMKSLSIIVVVLLAVSVQASAAYIIEDGSTADTAWNDSADNVATQAGDAADYYMHIAVDGDTNSSNNAITWKGAGNLDWSSYTSIELDMKMNIATPTDRVRLRWNSGGTWTGTDDMKVINTAGTGWGSYSFDISTYARSDVDTFVIYLNTVGVGDYEVSIDDLQLVPEPATMTLLLLGLPLALRRRR